MLTSSRLRAKKVCEPKLFAVPKTKRIDNPRLIAMLKLHVRKCEWCGVESHRTPWPIDPHHIKTRGAGGGDTLDNLVMLCRPHHDDAQQYKIHRAALLAILGPRLRDPWWQALDAQRDL